MEATDRVQEAATWCREGSELEGETCILTRDLSLSKPSFCSQPQFPRL